MLSTVGYGDFYPVSQNEMIYGSIVMLLGVAFFSYIMGVLFDIMTNYKQKMGDIDLSGDLTRWLLTLSRFRNKPLPYSLHEQIQQNMNYIWQNDRMMMLRANGVY